MVASIVLVVSWVLVLAVLGAPRRGPAGAGPVSGAALVLQGARTLVLLDERRHRRLGDPVATAGPAVVQQQAPCPSGPAS